LRRGTCLLVVLVLIPLLSLMPAAGCGGGGEGAISEIVLSNIVPQDSFTLYYPVTALSAGRVQPYSFSLNLSGVAGTGAVKVPAAVARTLGTQGFAGIVGGEEHIYEVYQGTAAAKFVTTDALLHSFHALYDYTLRDMEENFLVTDLEEMLDSLLDTVSRMYGGSGGKVRDATLADIAYLAVAARLLGIEADIPADAEALVDEELALIAGHGGFANSPIFGYLEDYGQYSPRGHYADGGELEGYFKAMTWLGRMGFFPRPGIGQSEIDSGRDMTRRALVLVGALNMAEVSGKPALMAWDSIYQPTAFMAGASDNLDVYAYTALAKDIYGNSFPLARLSDDALMDEFISSAIEEGSSSTGLGSVTAEGSVSFRLFGQRDIPDASIFGKLVEAEVSGRFMPRGLDVPAALGSDRALQILDQVYQDSQYEGFTQNMDELRSEFEDIDPVQAHSSIYWGWLDTLRSLIKPCGEGYPTFMQGISWQDRDLYSFLGSWTELRHDTVLYAKQSETQVTAPPPGSVVKGYVEPRPETYARLAATTDMLRRGLGERNLASPAVQERLDALYELLIALKSMAEKELHNESLSPEEYQTIADIGDTLKYLALIPVEGEGDRTSEAEPPMALVTDVHTDLTYGEVLEVAVGRPVTYYVIAPVEGQPTLTVGAGFSYYEFIKPADERLTDEAWRGMLESGQAPILPAWAGSFLQP
jgi:hypothetical protein